VIPLVGVLPLALLWQDTEPLVGLVLSGQFPVVLEDDRWRVTGFEGDLQAWIEPLPRKSWPV
jgi:hypothetical protein